MIENGDGLIFLLSQPRSGSTMLQRMLGGHPDVHTVAESWLMLTPFHARWKGRELYESLNLDWVHQTFLSNIPRGEEEYLEGVRRMYGYLYGRLLAASGKRLFLDKTPRYFWIIPELHETFPSARFLILFRNPLAVLCSMLDLWIERRWIFLREWKGDLIDAPARLVAAIQQLGPNAHVVKFEDLVKDPDTETQRICQWLGIPFHSRLIEYGNNGLSKFQIGDPDGVYSHTRPAGDRAEAWQEKLHDAQVWRLLSDYLEFLGPELLAKMGYCHEELRSLLDRHRPNRTRLVATLPLNYIMKLKKEPVRFIYYDLIRLLGSGRRRGIRQTARLAYRRLRSDALA
jgi:hypothetical protein